jgi:hypothetical protein
MPFNFKIYNDFKMPKLNRQFNMNYEECCNSMAHSLLTMARVHNKPITVLYSGGIDSTLVLISFLKNCNHSELRDLVTVALSPDSIVENPNFYFDHVRKKFNIITSNNLGSYFDGSRIIVGGEFNDQIFGSDALGGIYREFDYNKINDSYSREFISGWFILKGMSVTSANYWFDLIDAQIKTVDCEITTNFHFFWWINFCFKWQSVYFRILARVNIDIRQNVTHEFIRQHYHHYFSSVDFQQWSMQNHDKKLSNNWNSYKVEAKRIIFEYNSDIDYRDNKIKIGSLSKLFRQCNTADAIDSEFKYIDRYQLNPLEYYNPQNDFI